MGNWNRIRNFDPYDHPAKYLWALSVVLTIALVVMTPIRWYQIGVNPFDLILPASTGLVALAFTYILYRDGEILND